MDAIDFEGSRKQANIGIERQVMIAAQTKTTKLCRRALLAVSTTQTLISKRHAHLSICKCSVCVACGAAEIRLSPHTLPSLDYSYQTYVQYDALVRTFTNSEGQMSGQWQKPK